jgi:hypothetical protein
MVWRADFGGAPFRGEHIVCHYSTGQKMPPVREILLALLTRRPMGVVKAEDLELRAQAFDDYLVAGNRNHSSQVTLNRA